MTTPPTGPQQPGQPFPQQPGQPFPQQPGQQHPYPQQPGQPYPQQPYPGPGQPQPKKSKKWLWAIVAVVILVIIIAVATGGGEEAENNSSTSSSEAGDNGNNGDSKGDDKTVGLNTPVRDGKFEFVVTGVESGLSSVGDNEYLAQKAQGQFVVVSMTVKNIGDKAQSFSPSNQKLEDTDGRTFETDSSAQIALGDTDVAVWDEINPGNSVEIKLVFDMPKDATPETLEVHDSMFSDGVNVALK